MLRLSKNNRPASIAVNGEHDYGKRALKDLEVVKKVSV